MCGTAGAVVGVDGEQPAGPGLEPGGGEVQGGGVARPPGGHEHRVDAEPAAGVEFQRDVAVFVRLAAGDAVLPEELDAELAVHRVFQARARPRCRGTAAARRGRRRSRPRSPARRRCRRTRLPMTPAPMTASDRGSRSSWRMVSESSTRGWSKRELGRDGRARNRWRSGSSRPAGGSRGCGGGGGDRGGGGPPCPWPPSWGWTSVTTRIVWGSRNEAVPWYRTTPLPRQAALDPLALVGRDPPLVEHELGHGGLAAEREVHAVEVARLEPRDRQRRLAQGLAGQGAGVGRGAADHRAALDDRRPLAEQRPPPTALSPAGPEPITIRSYEVGSIGRMIPRPGSEAKGAEDAEDAGRPRRSCRRPPDQSKNRCTATRNPPSRSGSVSSSSGPRTIGSSSTL